MSPLEDYSPVRYHNPDLLGGNNWQRRATVPHDRNPIDESSRLLQAQLWEREAAVAASRRPSSQ
ncbi:hypothetical protein BKA82DRAFT_1005930 [Pisolithus tinctorius]|uniref:Uncharacterized protein n=1 Tax=Pisolithus tinctorius Marx 270 TaxID=870435 RepID=A0A0C3IKX4_PISTI|nr:hypothetical protein BKA82DRAFT_1005930 [Pisolithus tinctorius]KIN97627.1 hypothetical protein M404DRAFT_1005930 [Pisolithus tinctorius Marx 270]